MRYLLNYFFHLKEYFMTLSMEYNVVRMSAAALLVRTYSRGPIFNNFVT